MKLTMDFKEHLIKLLKDPGFALGYLNECLKDEDERVFLLALRDVTEAYGGVNQLAKKVKLSREHLFRLLSNKGNPRFDNLRKIAHAFGWRIAFVPEKDLKKAA